MYNRCIYLSLVVLTVSCLGLDYMNTDTDWKENSLQFHWYILIAGFEMMNDSTSFWTDIFTKYFIDPSKLPDDQRDDMLFYVRKTHNPKNKSFTFRVSSALSVWMIWCTCMIGYLFVKLIDKISFSYMWDVLFTTFSNWLKLRLYFLHFILIW